MTERLKTPTLPGVSIRDIAVEDPRYNQRASGDPSRRLPIIAPEQPVAVVEDGERHGQLALIACLLFIPTKQQQVLLHSSGFHLSRTRYARDDMVSGAVLKSCRFVDCAQNFEFCRRWRPRPHKLAPAKSLLAKIGYRRHGDIRLFVRSTYREVACIKVVALSRDPVNRLLTCQ